MDLKDLIVKNALALSDGNSSCQYVLVGKPHGRNCLFKVWQGKNKRHDVWILKYDTSLHDANLALEHDSTLQSKTFKPSKIDLNDERKYAKAMKLVEWLDLQHMFEKPIHDSCAKLEKAVVAAKGKENADKRLLAYFSDEDSAWVSEFTNLWNDDEIKGYVVFGVKTLMAWGIHQQPFDADALIADYCSYASMMQYHYKTVHETDMLDENTLDQLVRQTMFHWTPEEEQRDVPDEFTPGLKYNAAHFCRTSSLFYKFNPKLCGTFAWNDDGNVKVVVKARDRPDSIDREKILNADDS